MNFSDTLIEQILEAKRGITLDLSSYNAVVENLKFLYDACIASEELLRQGFKYATDSYLEDYYKKHLEEEKGEIEILKNDLKNEIFFPRVPGATAMAMIGSQYYMIKHLNPVCLLGYMAIMEADPTPIEVVKIVEELYGKELFGFLRLHAIKDLEHAKELKDVIDSVPVGQRHLIKFSCFNALGYLEQACKEWR